MKHLVNLVISLFVVLPVMVLVWLSLADGLMYPNVLVGGLTISYWKSIFMGSEGLGWSLLWSLMIASVVAFASTVFGFIISKKIALSRRGEEIIKLAYLPYLIAPVILGAMLQFYFTRAGLTGSVLGVVVAQLLFVSPYAVLIFSGFWTSNVKQLLFQATTLGASKKYVFKKVELPLARPWFFLAFFQCFLISWFEYGITQLIGVGKVQTLTIKTMVYVKEASPQYGAVAACIMILPLLVLLIVNARLFLKREVVV